MNTITNYTPIWVKYRGTYKCNCGHRFYRSEKDYFTRSPLNTSSDEECFKKCEENCKRRLELKTCPKCDSEVAPYKIVIKT